VNAGFAVTYTCSCEGVSRLLLWEGVSNGFFSRDNFLPVVNATAHWVQRHAG